MSLYERIGCTGIMNPGGIEYEEFDRRVFERYRPTLKERLGTTGMMNPDKKSLKKFDPAYL